jgi:hypothetical protein
MSDMKDIDESAEEIAEFLHDMIDKDDWIPQEHKAGLQTVTSAAVHLVWDVVLSLDRIATALEKIAERKESMS